MKFGSISPANRAHWSKHTSLPLCTQILPHLRDVLDLTWKSPYWWCSSTEICALSLIGCYLHAKTNLVGTIRDTIYTGLCRATSTVWKFCVDTQTSDVSSKGRIEHVKREVCLLVKASNQHLLIHEIDLQTTGRQIWTWSKIIMHGI